MKGKKHYSSEQILKLLSEADTRLNSGQSAQRGKKQL